MKTKLLSVLNRLTNKGEALTKSQLRKIRKNHAKGIVPKNSLPYNAQSINRIFSYLKPITDADLTRIEIPTVSEVPQTTSAVKAPAPAAKGKTKMTIEIVREIRNGKYGKKASEVAKNLSIGETTARDIINGKTWKEPATV